MKVKWSSQLNKPVTDPGGGGGRPLTFRPNWGPKERKNFSFATASPHPPFYLRVWMTGPPPYLKVWIRHCKQSIQCFHMTPRRPYWCPKTMTWRPSCCPKPILWELNCFLMQTLSFVEWKHSIVSDWKSQAWPGIDPWPLRWPDATIYPLN